MRNHVTALGWIHIVLDGLGLIMGILLLFLFLGIGGAISATGGHDAAPALPVLGVIGTFLLGLFAVLSIPGLIAGIGLLNFAPWSRILAIVLSVIHLFNFPFGTAL